MSCAADLSCPSCGAELDIASLFAHETDQRAITRLISVSIPMGTRVLQYCTLFQPPKTRLTAAKKIKLILQLLPHIERQELTFKGRDWYAPVSVWSQAIDQMLESRDAGRLDLPMKGHAYLYSIVTSLSDKLEAQREAESLTAARRPPTVDTVQVRGQTMSIGDALQAVHGDKDPALDKIAADAKRAAPMPAEIRARIAALRGAIPQPPTQSKPS